MATHSTPAAEVERLRRAVEAQRPSIGLQDQLSAAPGGHVRALEERIAHLLSELERRDVEHREQLVRDFSRALPAAEEDWTSTPVAAG